MEPLQSVGFTIGGLGIFLYGLLIFSDYLKELAGVRLRTIITRIGSNVWSALFTGLVITAIWQASSITTVVAVALVNAGMLSFEGALGLIFGANIGTTVTAQIVAFNITQWGLFIIPVGLLIYIAGRKKRIKSMGMAIFSFGLILGGLWLIQIGLEPLKDSVYLQNLLVTFSDKPWLGIIAGTIFTALVQSSSATTSIVVALGSQGLMTFSAAIPLVLGANIGTTITTLIASVGTRLSARRTAMAHLLFNIIGVLLIYPFVVSGWFQSLVVYVSRLLGDASLPRLIANSHTIFNIIWSVFWAFQVNNFAAIVKWLVRGEEKVYSKPNYLSEKLLSAPSLALDALRSTLKYMAEVSSSMLTSVFEMIMGEEKYNSEDIWNMENLVDDMQRECLEYSNKLSQSPLSEDDVAYLSAIVHSVDDVERWGDHATNLLEFAEFVHENNVKFSPKGQESLKELFGLVKANLDRALQVIDDGFSENLLEMTTLTEEQIDQLVKELRNERTERLIQGELSVQAAIIYVDILTNLERVADHTLNVVQNFSRTEGETIAHE
ncbi:Na/Pi cotransporter family protein [Coprothermobacter platensis]|uniref:Na/Pi cotransporter family protein n=1 Tax=Coprothermobacter platensis TaxID=108819 RepID=UPI000361D5D4|nr:Na/Pi cotransporter family protein [Coprothermobacter platensis]